MLLLGHRGAVGSAHQENTVAAVERALHLGADGVEVDVRLTRDGGLACVHDPSLLRVAGVADAVAWLPTAELVGRPLPGGGVVASVGEVVAAVRGRGRLVLELKTYGAPEGARGLTAVALAAELRRQGVTRRDDVVVSSFDRGALATFARRSGIRTALVTAADVPVATAAHWALHAGHDELHAHVRPLLAAPSSFVRDAHALGLAVTAWTVNRRTDLRRLAARGVDGVICDDPAAARAALAAATTGAV